MNQAFDSIGNLLNMGFGYYENSQKATMGKAITAQQYENSLQFLTMDTKSEEFTTQSRYWTNFQEKGQKLISDESDQLIKEIASATSERTQNSIDMQKKLIAIYNRNESKETSELLKLADSNKKRMDENHRFIQDRIKNISIEVGYYEKYFNLTNDVYEETKDRTRLMEKWNKILNINLTKN